MDKDTNAEMAMAWRVAAEDLQIQVTAPYAIQHETESYQYAAWIHGFASDNGLLVYPATESRSGKYKRCDVAISLGFECIAIAPVYCRYEREWFTMLLNMYRWFGGVEDKPDWHEWDRSIVQRFDGGL